jgi:drug/metabolite transporter (DMT)-like permease
VQSVIAGGLVLLTVFASRLFGVTVSRREWIGVAVTAAGLAFLAATLDGTADSAHADYGTATLAGYVGLATVVGLVLVPLARVRPSDGIVLAVSAGLLWGGSDIAIKALSDHTSDGIGVLANPLALVILVLSLVGLLISARSLQLGPVVPVIAITSATANVLTIAAGPIVFGEPMPAEPLAVVVRVIAFVLVIGAAALTPPPLPTVDAAAVEPT